MVCLDLAYPYMRNMYTGSGNKFRTPDYAYENTQKLTKRAHALIGSGNLLSSTGSKRNITATGSGSKPDSVKAARKQIQDEWEALKNASIISENGDNNDADVAVSSNINKGDILLGVVAYIEINNYEKAKVLRKMLLAMGASVSENFTKEVTHIVFKQGSLETYKKAKLLNVHLVSILWIEACKNSKKRVLETMFPIVNVNDYSESPRLFREFMERHGHNAELFPINQVLISDSNDVVEFDMDILTGVTSVAVHKSSTSNTSDLSLESLRLRISSDNSCDRSNENSVNLPKDVCDKDIPEISANAPSESSNLVLKSIENVNLNNELATKSAPNSAAKRKLFSANPSREIYLETIRESENMNITLPTCNIVNPYRPPARQKTCIKKNNSKMVTPSKTNISGITALKEANTPTPKKLPYKRVNPECFRSTKANGKKVQSLVTSSMHSHENTEVKNIIIQLGGFVFKANVCPNTTHLVVGGPRRTVNILRAIARGCWILRKQWLQDSFNCGYWLDEQSYELTEFSSAVQRCRLERQTFGNFYQLDIFKGCGSMHIHDDSTPAAKDIKELVLLCGGKLSSSVLSADIIVGKYISYHSKCLTEKWILDSITYGRCKTFKRYLIPAS